VRYAAKRASGGIKKNGKIHKGRLRLLGQGTSNKMPQHFCVPRTRHIRTRVELRGYEGQRVPKSFLSKLTEWQKLLTSNAKHYT
jgi:hypothetical protein